MLKKLVISGLCVASLFCTVRGAIAETKPGTTITAAAETQTITPKKRALIEELRRVTHSEEQATEMMDIMIENMEKQFMDMSGSMMGNDAPPEAQQEMREMFSRITKRIYALAKEKIDFAALQEKIDTQTYDKYYSEAELQDLLNFYKTPTGQKMIAALPKITQESMETYNEAVVPTLMEIQQQVLMEEMNNMQPDAPKQPGM